MPFSVNRGQFQKESEKLLGENFPKIIWVSHSANFVLSEIRKLCPFILKGSTVPKYKAGGEKQENGRNLRNWD